MKRFTCDEVVELVTVYMEGELDGPTGYRFEEHLGGCEGCERYLGQFRTTVATLGDLRPDGLAGDTREGLLAAFRDWRRP